MCAQAGQEKTYEGEFGAARRRASSFPAHLAISPGKLSIGEGGRWEDKSQLESRECGGRVSNWERGSSCGRWILRKRRH